MTMQVEKKSIVAVPVSDGKLCSHFGHCQQFAFYEVEMGSRQIHGSRCVDPPPHEPGLLPRWLHGENASVVIAGGMGKRAQDIFRDHGIQVVVGASADHPMRVVQAFLDGKLTLADNPCDH